MKRITRIQFFKTIVTPTLIYEPKSWTTTGKYKRKIEDTEMSFFKKTEEKTRMDKIN